MAIWDVFTGKPGKDAAADQRKALEQIYGLGTGVVDAGVGQARGDVRAGADAAQPYLTDAYGNSQRYLSQGYERGLDSLGQGYRGAVDYTMGGANDALGYIDQGTGEARGALSGARSDLMGGSAAYQPLDDLARKYGAGSSLYLNALGVNGADAATKARESFATSPGYDFQVNQGLDAINRRRAAGGMLASGNADYDALNYASGLASKEYGGWLDRLGGMVNPELSATSGAATGRAGMARSLADLGVTEANLLSGAGAARAGIAGERGQMLAGLASQYGKDTTGLHTGYGAASSNLSTGYGDRMAGLETGTGNTLANLTMTGMGQKTGLLGKLSDPYTKTYKDAADAEMGGSSNLWNFGLNLAKLGTGAVGKGGMFAPGGRFGSSDARQEMFPT